MLLRLKTQVTIVTKIRLNKTFVNDLNLHRATAVEFLSKVCQQCQLPIITDMCRDRLRYSMNLKH